MDHTSNRESEKLPASAGTAAAKPTPNPVQSFVDAFDTRLEFFGKVQDQYGAPVVDADVRIYVTDNPVGAGSTLSRRSGAGGEFSVEGVTGISMGIEVSKPGYRTLPPANYGTTSSGVFRYAVGTDRHVPEGRSPVIFRLHKLENMPKLLRLEEKNYSVPREGTPLRLSIDGSEERVIVLRCWNDELHHEPRRRRYDWRLEISVPDGGLLRRGDPLDFLAPSAGYVQKDVIDMPASLGASWRSFREQFYFVRFADETFALVSLDMRAGGDHFVIFEAVYNPAKGARNLETLEAFHR